MTSALSFKARVDPLCLSHLFDIRFTSGVKPTDYIEVSMAAEPFQSTYFQMCPQAFVEVGVSNPQLPVSHAASTVL